MSYLGGQMLRYFERMLVWSHTKPSRIWEYVFLASVPPFLSFALCFVFWPKINTINVFLGTIPLSATLAGLLLAANLGTKSYFYFSIIGFYIGTFISVLLNIFWGHFIEPKIYIYVFVGTIVFAMFGVFLTLTLRFLILHISTADLSTSHILRLMQQIMPPIITALVVYFFTGQVP